MMRSLLLLASIGVCFANFNYHTTHKVISEEEKENMLRANPDDAFDQFMNNYDDMERDGFTGPLSPEEEESERLRQKRIFTRNIEIIKEHNKRYARGEVSYKMVVNSFAVMDEDNRRMFLGLGRDSLNPSPLEYGLGGSRYESGVEEAGLYNASYEYSPPQGGLGSARAATTLDWRNQLGPIKNQGTCGSCWTYPATALLEFAIKKSTGRKLALSEQQLLDCTYESQNYNACGGGWYYQAWDYIIKNNNKLASEADYSYKNADGPCYDTYYSNALAGKIKLKSYTKLSASQVVDKMQVTPIAVAFFVDNRFYSIGSGVFDGCYTYYPSNHAVTLTGYGNGYWEIRNSWGADWGNRGYGRFRRSGTRSICNLLSDAYIISYTSQGGDVDPVDPTDKTDPECSDSSSHAANCPGWRDAGYCDTGDYVEWMAQNCKKTCGACGDTDGDTDDDCQNVKSDSDCANWQDNYSYCTQGDYIEWMKINCAKTCRACKEREREEEKEEEEKEEEEERRDCEDKSEYADRCGGWKDDGYCAAGNEYAEWMNNNCCGTCRGGDDGEEEEEEEEEERGGDCENDHEKCAEWARKGYCTNESYRDYMTTNCQKSCDTCMDEEPTEEATDPVAQLIPHQKVSQSSTQKVKKRPMEATFAVDGDDSTRSQTKCSKKDAWFKYKFQEASRVSSVEILNGNFDQKREKLNGASVFVQEVDGLKRKCGDITTRSSSSKTGQTYTVDCGGTYASAVEITQTTKFNKKKCLELKEVRVFGFAGEFDPTASSASSGPTSPPTEGEREREDDNDGCPGGTVRCPDGICKHIHMCGRG